MNRPDGFDVTFTVEAVFDTNNERTCYDAVGVYVACNYEALTILGRRACGWRTLVPAPADLGLRLIRHARTHEPPSPEPGVISADAQHVRTEAAP